MPAQAGSGERHNLGLYIGATFLLSWGAWIAAAHAGQDVNQSPWLVAYLLGGFAPSAVGLALVYRENADGQARWCFWRRTIGFRRIARHWYLLIALLVPLLAAASLLVGALLTRAAPPLTTLREIATNPAVLVGVLAFSLILGPLSEELGWRGYALDRLQRRWSPLGASLILGVIWAVWHIPLFWVQGTPQHEMGMGSARFWLFLAVGIPLSVLMTAAYNRNGRSILSAILLHWVFNLTMSLAHPLWEAAYLALVLLMVCAAIVFGDLRGVGR